MSERKPTTSNQKNSGNLFSVSGFKKTDRDQGLNHLLRLWLAWNQQSIFDGTEPNEEVLFLLIAQR